MGSWVWWSVPRARGETGGRRRGQLGPLVLLTSTIKSCSDRRQQAVPIPPSPRRPPRISNRKPRSSPPSLKVPIFGLLTPLETT